MSWPSTVTHVLAPCRDACATTGRISKNKQAEIGQERGVYAASPFASPLVSRNACNHSNAKRPEGRAPRTVSRCAPCNEAREKPLDKHSRRAQNEGMKLRQLPALGAVLLLLTAASPSVSAEEAKMNALQTALSSTTISGYVDTSVEWTLGDKDTTVVQAAPSHGFGSWWRSFRVWVRAHHGWR